MSDTWYRRPVELPPYEDGFGKLWMFDGRCVNPDPPEPTFVDEWPEDLRSLAFQASVTMELVDAYDRAMWGPPSPLGFLP
jgi:hypothetical protein